ncbi:MAG: hypothetical protein NTW65_05785 [Deltaproteobacteria bacterium]|nr:hypothetical protein [Deltaproteobacteria bacterium]
MKKLICTEKGLSIVECMVAFTLTIIAMVALMSMQPLALQGAGKSDILSRASNLMQSQLNSYENSIMIGANVQSNTAYADERGNVPPSNNASTVFTITTTITTPSGFAAGTKLVNVKITWPGSKNGIKNSIIVSPQSW